MQDETGIIAIVATNVRLGRKAAGLSQEELAFEAEIDRTYVSQIERAIINPSREKRQDRISYRLSFLV